MITYLLLWCNITTKGDRKSILADGSRGRVRNDQEAMAAESGIVSLHPYPHRKWGGCGGEGREMSESGYKPLKPAPRWDISSNKAVFPRFHNLPKLSHQWGKHRFKYMSLGGPFFIHTITDAVCLFLVIPLMSPLLSMIYKIRPKPCLASPFPRMCCFRTGPRIFVVEMDCI